MRAYFKNIGYFLKETKAIFQLNWISNIFTLLSTGLIFFILATVISLVDKQQVMKLFRRQK